MVAKQSSKKARKKIFKAGLVLSLLILSFSLLTLFFWMTTRSLFSKNDHFKLKNFYITGSGWWKDHPLDVMKKLKLEYGKTNIFAVELDKLRKKLKQEPGIKNVNIRKKLPDTLIINVRERIPVAKLKHNGKDWYIDDSCVLIKPESSLNIDKDLPELIALKSLKNMKLYPGDPIPQYQNALNLLKMLSEKKYGFSKFSVSKLAVKNDIIIFIMHYRHHYRSNPDKYLNLKYKVYMNSGKLKSGLSRLKNSVKQAFEEKRFDESINLTFDEEYGDIIGYQ